LNVYFETSAFFKLIVDESGSAAALELWDAADWVTGSRVTYAEARAALASASRGGRVTPVEMNMVRSRLDTRWDQFEIVELDDEISRSAGDLAETHALRGFDSVHLASAVALSDETLILASWDVDLRRAAADAGLQVAPTN
jgi:predicted nucleic acid-binding protein